LTEDNSQGPTDKNQEEEFPQVYFSWKDILAFCAAMYRLLIPQLLLTLLVVTVFVFLLFWLWFN